MVKTFINYLIIRTITITKKDYIGCGDFFRCKCCALVVEHDNFCSNCGKKLKFKEID